MVYSAEQNRDLQTPYRSGAEHPIGHKCLPQFNEDYHRFQSGQANQIQRGGRWETCSPKEQRKTFAPSETNNTRKTGRFHINLEQFAKQEDSAPKRFRTKPGAVLAKQEDSTSTWSNSQNRKIPHQKDSAPNLVQYSQNRKIPHQPGAIRKTERFHINLEQFTEQEDSASKRFRTKPGTILTNWQFETSKLDLRSPHPNPHKKLKKYVRRKNKKSSSKKKTRQKNFNHKRGFQRRKLEQKIQNPVQKKCPTFN